MKKLLTVFTIVFILLSSCYNDGYQYRVYLKDSTTIDAWEIEFLGDGISVHPKFGKNEHYYISNKDFERYEYVGIQHREHTKNLKNNK